MRLRAYSIAMFAIMAMTAERAAAQSHLLEETKVTLPPFAFK